MSDLYLVLRSRLDIVRGEWIEVPSEVMRSARVARGLSYEAMGRLLHVSGKTYERHEKDGRIPRGQVERYADVLGLEIERPTFSGTITVPPDSTDDKIDAILRLVRQLQDEVAELRRETQDPEEGRRARPAAS